MLALEVALEDLFDILPDAQGRDVLQVGMPLQEDDAVDDLVRVLHLLDQLFALFLCELGEAPVREQSVMQPVLVHRAKLVLQRVVQNVDDVLVALHGGASPCA